MTTQLKYFLTILALLILPVSGLTIDIYVPSLPAVSQYFLADKSLVQLTITVYMVGLGVMQLFAGSISDSFGRRKPFLVAMFLYIVITFIVPLSQNIYQLLFLRFLQGSVVALTVVPIRSLVFDLYEGRELHKWMNYMTMAWSIGPIIAPAIGGYLQHYFGWQANFYFLAIYSLILFITMFLFLPETSLHRHPFNTKEIFKRYYTMLFTWRYASGLFMNGTLYSLIILFSIVAPFLVQTVLHYSPIDFGHISLLMGLSWFLGTMTNRLLLDVDIAIKTQRCLWLMLPTAIIMLIASWLTPLNIYTIVIPVVIILWLGGTIFPNYFTMCISLFPKNSGSANALFGSFVFFIAGVSSAFGTLLKSTSEIPLAWAYIFLISLCLIIFYMNILTNHRTTAEK